MIRNQLSLDKVEALVVTRKRTQRSNHCQRRGTALIIVLATVAVAMSVIGTALAASIKVHREGRMERRRAQIQFLGEIGAWRAANQLRVNKEFSGESISIESAEQRETAVVSSSIVTSVDQSQRIQVIVSLGETNGSPHLRIQQTMIFPWNYKQPDRELE